MYEFEQIKCILIFDMNVSSQGQQRNEQSKGNELSFK